LFVYGFDTRVERMMLVLCLLKINFILDISLHRLRLTSVFLLVVYMSVSQQANEARFYIGAMLLKKYHFAPIFYWRNISFGGFPYQCDINAILVVPGIKKRQLDHKGAMPILCSFSSFTWCQYRLIHLSAICVKTTLVQYGTISVQYRGFC